MFFYYLQRLRCLVYLCHFYDMSVANEAKRPVPNGVLLPYTTIYLQLFIPSNSNDKEPDYKYEQFL